MSRRAERRETAVGRPGKNQSSERALRSDGALNRAKIVDVAGQLLADSGDISISAVARATSLSRGTVHRHFATREALISAVRDQAREDTHSGEDRLRPAGQLANVAFTPLSVTDVLNKVPPFQLGEQIIAEARRLPAISSVALYVVDVDGTRLQRLAGPATFPEQVTAPLAVGPELPREGIAALSDVFGDVLPGATLAPLELRGRAIGVLAAVGSASPALNDLAADAAVALALAPLYTDYIDTKRRTRPTSPAAEIQQNLLPPRVARVSGATLAGNVLPGYEFGGDWFDYTENPLGVWIGIFDSAGIGALGAGASAITLGAFRSTRRHSPDVCHSLRAMHDAIGELPVRATATIAHWNAPSATLTWVSAGPQQLFRVDADSTIRALGTGNHPQLGDPTFPDPIITNSCRVGVGERILMLSDSFTQPPHNLTLTAISDAVVKADNQAAPATVRAIEDQLRAAHPDQLQDDATLVVLAPSPPVGDLTRRSA